VNFDQHYTLVANRQIKLTPTESRLIQLLYNQRGQVLSPGALLARAWDPVSQGTLRSLWVLIRRLRNKIEPNPDEPRYIVTARGRRDYLPTWRGEPETRA
jgi:DNA-binding response OmpR family regulator